MTVWPRTGCSILVQDRDRFLLVKRGKEPYKGFWSLPGGAQELGETLEECAKRELMEETGLMADEVRFAAVRDRITRNSEGEITHHYVLATFLAIAYSGEASASDDAEELGWFTADEIGDLETTPGALEFIKSLGSN